MDSRIFDIDYINAKIYHYENIDRYRKVVRDYRKKRMNNDSEFKLLCNMRTRLNIAFKKRNWKKDSITSKLVGGTVQEVVVHIQSKFKEGMNWNNYGKWHVDHIIPLCSAKSSEEMANLCHFSNLQPLWAKENIRKRGKVEISI